MARSFSLTTQACPSQLLFQRRPPPVSWKAKNSSADARWSVFVLSVDVGELGPLTQRTMSSALDELERSMWEAIHKLQVPDNLQSTLVAKTAGVSSARSRKLEGYSEGSSAFLLITSSSSSISCTDSGSRTCKCCLVSILSSNPADLHRVS